MNAPPGLDLAELSFHNGVWQCGKVSDFSAIYHRTRAKEGRLLPDGVVVDLPEHEGGQHRSEWLARKADLRWLLAHMKNGPLTVLDIGCGNGWMSTRLARAGHHVVGVDPHAEELHQAARVFGAERQWWVRAELQRLRPIPKCFDRIVFASSIQYFKDAPQLLAQWSFALKNDGAIVILGSPLYRNEEERAAAQARSLAHYAGIGAPDMIDRYHHHALAEVSDGFEVDFHRPSLFNRWSRALGLAVRAFPAVVLRPKAG